MAEALIVAADEAASRLTETAGQGRATTAGTSLLDQYTGELVALVRRYPVTSVLIGLGVGVLLARSLGRIRPGWGVSPSSVGLIPRALAVRRPGHETLFAPGAQASRACAQLRHTRGGGGRFSLTFWFPCWFYGMIISFTIAGRRSHAIRLWGTGRASRAPRMGISAWSRGWWSVQQDSSAVRRPAQSVLPCMDRPTVRRASRKVGIRTHAWVRTPI
jgi:hypothetical protein